MICCFPIEISTLKFEKYFPRIASHLQIEDHARFEMNIISVDDFISL
jgi:hypothetical protein